MRPALVFGAIAAAAVAAIWFGASPPAPTIAAAPPPAAAQTPPARPRLPPGPDDAPPRPPPEPAFPLPTEEVRSALSERASGAARPGMTAFRAFSDLYVDQNLDFARKQAESEGLTLEQVRELTHFGLLVLATQRVPDVEEILGRSLSDAERETLSALMISSNREFKEKMRALVAARASEADRWILVRAAQGEYLADFYAATGMNEGLLDELLAGNMALPGAPAATEVPSEPAPPPEPADRKLHPTRPR